MEEEQHLHKHLGGCMAGFFNIFDRPHLLSPKRLSSSPPPIAESDSASERSSVLKSRHSGSRNKSVYSTPELRSPRSPLTPPAVVGQQGPSSRSPSPWRFSKEAPRLSLDSRAVVDAKGTLKPRQIRSHSDAETERGSPSVIARLMGLEPLPQQPLQRSASESRVRSRDYRFVDSFNFQDDKATAPGEDPAAVRTSRAQPARAPRRKCFFDSGDFFPEPRQLAVSKMSGFDAPPTDLETLKQLLEALRLKGLLHSSHKHQSRTLVFDSHHSPIKPPSPAIRSGRADRGSGARCRISPSTSVKTPNRRPTLKEQRRVSPLPCRRPEPLHTGIKQEKEVSNQNHSLR